MSSKLLGRAIAQFCLWLMLGAIALAQSKVSAPVIPPVLGADLTYADSPHPLIDAWGDKLLGDEMAAAFRNAGLRSLRFSFHGFYSPAGVEATARVRAENKTPNEFPWFSFDRYVEYISTHGFTTVVAVNVEEGPDVAEQVVKRFIERNALDKLVAIELSNEPHLNHRPWVPEEFADRAASVIERLTPHGVRFALPLTVGTERKTPTRLSDNEWNSRMMRQISRRIDLKSRTDILGVLHLYAGGVRGKSVDIFNKAVRPFAPGMRYLVTEFNIRSNLAGNPHLTNRYGMEFARKVAELMLQPEIEAMFVHSVPYHSIAYWSNGKRIATVIGLRDPKLTEEKLTRGWHLTPAGEVYRLYSRLAWNGELVVSGSTGRRMWWAVRTPDGKLVLTFLNDEDKTRERKLKIDGREIKMVAPPRSIVSYDGAGLVLGRLTLPY